MNTDKTDNELIAEFMGLRRHEGNMWNDDSNGTIIWTPEYEKHWGLLMPVLDKIDKPGVHTVASQSGKMHYINIMTGVGILKDTVDNPSKFMGWDRIKIIAYHSAISQFIKWYNENKKP